MKRRTMLGIAAGLTTTLLIGAGAVAVGAHAGRHHVMKRFVSSMIDDALDAAQVTPAQRPTIHQARDRAFAAVETHRKDRRMRLEQGLALFEADRLDQQAVREFVEQREQEHRLIADAIGQALIDVHDTLTPAQRKALADYVRSHARRHMD
ncbi:MAG: periplasmic heavy metal sensor [Candidatus Rokuibacteriota bacterium]